MIIMISLIGFLIFTTLLLGLDNIKIELRYRNTLLKEQNQILKDRNKQINYERNYIKTLK